ncbi:MAG: hypothetical protein LBV12_07665, partial [Puniceicoccales bacterium]|nr:hypothetical protein [Puniceicoccales bacterium]
MKLLEAVIVILIAVIILQDLLRLLGRTSLLYPCYVLVGLLLGTVLAPEAAGFLREVGGFGFIFLLFLIGLEIELPGWRATIRAFLLGILWVAAHAVLIVPIGIHLDLKPESTLICLTALTACSVGMAHSAWEIYPHANAVSKQRMLIWMVALEVLAVMQFSAMGPLIEQGIDWTAALRLGLVAVAMVAVCWMAPKVARRLQVIIEITESWRLHA